MPWLTSLSAVQLDSDQTDFFFSCVLQMLHSVARHLAMRMMQTVLKNRGDIMI